MIKYSKEFLHQLDLVRAVREKLAADEKKLQELCPHANLDGSSAFPRGISFTDCRLCGVSSHDL